MRFVIQRVRDARVNANGKCLGRIGTGLVVLAGFGQEDGEDLPGSKVWEKMLDKLVNLRIFPDPEDRMKLSLKEWDGEVLVVSQFTLHADLKKGRRPSFHLAADPDIALGLYDRLIQDLEALRPGKVQSGEFGAMMNVALTNWGPVTIIMDSEDM